MPGWAQATQAPSASLAVLRGNVRCLTAVCCRLHAGLPGSPAPAEVPKRPRTESAAAASANAALYLLDTQEVSPGLIGPLAGSLQQPQQLQQQQGEAIASGAAMNGFHADDPEAVRRAVLARLAAQQDGSSCMQQQPGPPAVDEAVPMDVDEPAAAEQQVLPGEGGSASEAAQPELLAAEGTPDEASKEGGKPCALAETPDRAPDQAAADACKGNAPADLQLETPLKMDENTPAAAARDRPDSAQLA